MESKVDFNIIREYMKRGLSMVTSHVNDDYFVAVGISYELDIISSKIQNHLDKHNIKYFKFNEITRSCENVTFSIPQEYNYMHKVLFMLDVDQIIYKSTLETLLPRLLLYVPSINSKHLLICYINNIMKLLNYTGRFEIIGNTTVRDHRCYEIYDLWKYK
jgi:hypothetical protein